MFFSMGLKPTSAHMNISRCVFLRVLQRGETALHMAARAGQAEVVQYLLKNGAKVETKSKVRTMSLISYCVQAKIPARRHFFLLCRMTRLRYTSPAGWGKSTSSSSYCSVGLPPTLPPPQATPPSTWLPVKDTNMLLSCCWRTGPHSPLQPR